VKDAGATGARTAWTAGAQGQGSRPQAVSVTGATGSWPQEAVILNEPRRRSLRRRGPNAEGSCASGIRHWGGFEYNMLLWLGAGSILHDTPERSEVWLARGRPCPVVPACRLLEQAGTLTVPAGAGPACRTVSVAARLDGRAPVVPGRGAALFWLLGRCNGARPRASRGWRGASAAARSVTGPEARLIFPQAPVCELSARSEAERPGLFGRC
jgi:hypothetical protein